MEWLIEYWDELNTLYIKTSGILTTKDANKMVGDVVAAMSQYQCVKQIVDHRKTNLAFTTVDYYQRPNINEQIGISRTWKIAMVFSALDKNTRFMETVFKNRGYNFHQFSSLEDAKNWIADE